MAETLLLADDSITTQRVVELTFASEGLQVVSVSDGHQAIEYLSTHQPALALVSATLPKINGLEVVRTVRDRAELRKTPVLLLAGAFDTMDAAHAREAGAADVLFKPLEPGLVIKRVKELLGMSPKPSEEAPGTGRLITSGDTTARSWSGPEPAAPGDRVSGGDPAGRAMDSPRAFPARVNAPEEGDDYLGKLDAAFASLDARLAGRQAPPESGSQLTAPAPVPAADDSGPPIPAAEESPGVGEGVGTEKPVFEVDEQWFSGASGPPQPQAASTGRPEPSSVPERQVGGWNPYAPPGNAVPLPPSEGYGHIESVALTAASDPPPLTINSETPVSAEVSLDFSQAAPTPVPQFVAAAPQSPVAFNPPDANDTAVLSPLGHETKPSVSFQAADRNETPERPRDVWGDLNKAASARETRGAGETQVTRETSAPNPGSVADAFAMLWAHEQGEPLPPPPPVELDGHTVDAIAQRVTDAVTARVIDVLSTRVTNELARAVDMLADRLSNELATRIPSAVSERLSNEMTLQISGFAERVTSDISHRMGGMGDRLSAGLADHVASRVAERVLQSTFGDNLRQTVHDVSERLVREEIARIRSAVSDGRT